MDNPFTAQALIQALCFMAFIALFMRYAKEGRDSTEHQGFFLMFPLRCFLTACRQSLPPAVRAGRHRVSWPGGPAPEGCLIVLLRPEAASGSASKQLDLSYTTL